MNSTSFGITNSFMALFLNSINSGYTAIAPEVQFVTATIITIVILITGFLIAFGEDGMAGLFRIFPKKIIEIGFVLFLIEKWQFLTDAIGYSLGALGLKASGSAQNVTAFLQDPLTIVQDGFNLFTALMKTADNIPTGLTGFNHFPEVLGFGLAAIFIMVDYIYIAAEVFITFVEFKLINLAVLIFVPFSLLQQTKHLSQGAYISAFKFGAKFLVMAFVVTIGMNFVGQFTVNPAPDWDNLVAILTFSLVFAMLTRAAPHLAAGLISGGNPVGSGGGTLGAIAGLAGGAAAYGGAKAISALRGGGTGDGGSDLEKMKNAAGAGVGAPPSPFSQMAKAATAGQGGGVSSTGNSGSAREADT
jgi:type IV secretion system protein TrbL